MRQGAAAGALVPHGGGETDAARCRGGPGPHRVGGRWRVPPSGGALPRGLGLSLEKAQTKEHQGAAAPWTPGEVLRSSLALVGFWVGVSKGRSWGYDLRGIEPRFGTFTHLTGEMGILDFLRLRKTAKIDALKKYREMESLIFFCSSFYRWSQQQPNDLILPSPPEGYLLSVPAARRPARLRSLALCGPQASHRR